MRYQVPGKCSICGHEITITGFVCSHCHTRTEGEFTPCRFCSLEREQADFIEAFLKCRGNIKDVEKELGLSYPTIRNRLDEVLQALNLSAKGATAEPAPVQQNSPDEKETAEILNALEKGEISPQEALNRLKGRSKSK